MRATFAIVFDVDRDDVDMDELRDRIIDALSAYGHSPTTRPFEHQFLVGTLDTELE